MAKRPFALTSFPSSMPPPSIESKMTAKLEVGTATKRIRRCTVKSEGCEYSYDGSAERATGMRNIVVVKTKDGIKCYVADSDCVLPLTQSITTYKSTTSDTVAEPTTYNEQKKSLWDSFGSAKAARSLKKQNNNEIATQKLTTSNNSLKSSLGGLEQVGEGVGEGAAETEKALKLGREVSAFMLRTSER